MDELLKLKASALYVISKISPIDYYTLFKILYFADREHYSKYGKRIICDSFYALKDGPVPSALYDAIKHSKGVSIKPEFSTISDALNVSDNYYVENLENPDMDELSKSDVICLDKSIKENAGLRFKTLRKKSHDFAYESASKKNGIIDPLMMAQAGGCTDDFLEYLMEIKELKSILA